MAYVFGKYIYCITDTQEKEGVIVGIGGKETELVNFQDLVCVVSDVAYHDTLPYPMDRETLLDHERVNEKVMQTGTVLPVRFGTAAQANEDIIEQVLEARYEELTSLLQEMKGKVELSVRALWLSMPDIYQEITDENREIKRLRDALKKNQKKVSMQSQMKLGEMVQAALGRKRGQEAERIARPLREIAHSFKELPLPDDSTFFNAAFLVERAREKDFDQRVNEFAKTQKERTAVHYFGPTPPHNFVQLIIQLQPHAYAPHR